VTVIKQLLIIKNKGVGAVTVDAAGADTIDDELTQLVEQGDSMVIQCVAAHTWIII